MTNIYHFFTDTCIKFHFSISNKQQQQQRQIIRKNIHKNCNEIQKSIAVKQTKIYSNVMKVSFKRKMHFL